MMSMAADGGCRQILVLAFLFLAAAGSGGALAQTAAAFPSKGVKINVPYASGTGPDVFTRYLADRLSKVWGRQVIVESRPGASGFIAIEAMKNAVPDGHELILAANGHTAMNPAIYKKLPYDPEKDLVPVAMAYRTPLFIAVSTNGPYQTVRSLIAAAKAAPGQVSYGSPYVGSPSHLGTAEFELVTGTRMLHVPFKDQNQAFISIANGDLGWMLSTYASASPMMKADKIRLIAIASKQRLKSYPDIPTIEEAGGPAGLELEGWVAFFAPRGTPADIVRRINADVNQQLTAPEVVERMRVGGWEPTPSTPAELAELIRRDTRKYVDLVRRTGASID